MTDDEARLLFHLATEVLSPLVAGDHHKRGARLMLIEELRNHMWRDRFPPVDEKPAPDPDFRVWDYVSFETPYAIGSIYGIIQQVSEGCARILVSPGTELILKFDRLTLIHRRPE